MTTSNTQAQLLLGLDSAMSDFNDMAVNRVSLLHTCENAGKRVCNNVHRGQACLHMPPDGKQTADYCLRKLTASLGENINAVSHSTQSGIQHNSSLVPCKATDIPLGVTELNKPFQSQEFHISCSIQMIDDKLCDVSSASDAVHRFRAQSKGKAKHTKIRIKDMCLTAPYKPQLKISSPSMPSLKLLFCLRNACLDHTWHKKSKPCKLASQLKGAAWQRAENECQVGKISTGLVAPETKRKSNYTSEDFLEPGHMRRRVACDTASTEATWNHGKADALTVDDDDDYSDGDFDIPQFDGASDKITDPHKGPDKGKPPTTGNQNTGFPGSGDSNNQTPASDLSTSDGSWRTGAAERGLGNSQSYSSGSWPQGWPQQSGSGGGSWHGHSQSWTQQQQYEGWPQHQSLPSAFPPQQAPFRSASPAASFQSPPHNPYASPSHQQTFQAPSQYHYPPYQSPPSQSYQQLYQSPPHSYQHPRPSQAFHSSQPYNPSYQSTSASQTYQPLGASNQSYQLPTSNKPYPPTTGSQPSGPPSTGLPYQSPPSTHPFQQPANVPTYPTPYQTSHSNQTSHPQHYQSPAHELSQSSWSSQGFSGYNQSHASGKPEQHLGESPQHQPGTLYGQSDGQGHFFPSQALSATPASICGMTGPETQIGVPQVRQKRVYKKRKESKKVAKLKASESPGMSPTPVVSASLLESKSSSLGTPPLASETRYFQLQNDAKFQLDSTGDKESAVTSGNTSPLTKMSPFEFKPDIASFLSLDTEPSISKCVQLLNTSATIRAEKSDTTTTPMIQQLLMEEPIRMNIKKEDRDALMKKPIASPTLPKPKRKYKTRVKQSVKTPKRPRSTSLSSPVPPTVGYCGYSPQPIMNPSMIGRPGRSHSISLPFSCEPRMPSPIHSYGWQQWKPQHNLPPGSEWQEQQQHQWEIERQSFDSCGELGCSPAEMSKPELMINKLQHTPASAIQSTACSQNVQPSHSSSLFHNTFENNMQICSSSHAYSNRENVSEKSSLSSLFQLISDVGSDDTGWENDSVSIPNLFSNSSDSETRNLSMSVTDLNQVSPSAKDFITLETPCKQGYQKAYSDTAGMTSSEESDRIDLDLASDLKSRTVSRNHNVGSFHPRVGKLNRLKKLGILQTRTKLSSGNPMESNPSYTYTFHVPTTLFKKLKFFKSAETRKHVVNVVRMHPMDARRYSLMKIGREIVKVTRLTDADLASYNVTLPPAHFVSADGCTNRVNLDIPIVRADIQTADDGEKIIFSQFDTDFPPNKIAPPSSFCASQMSISVTSSIANQRSSAGSNWGQQYSRRSPANHNGGLSPVTQQGYTSQEGNFYCAPQQDELQQVSQANINRQSGSQLLEDSSDAHFHQSSQKTNSSYPTPSSTSEENHITNQQHVGMNPQPDQLQPNLQQQDVGMNPQPDQLQPNLQQQDVGMNPQPDQLQPNLQQQDVGMNPQPDQLQPNLQQQDVGMNPQPDQQLQPDLQQQDVGMNPQPDLQQQAGSSGFHPEPKNGLRSLGQHGLASRIENGRADISGSQEVKAFDGTTKSSLFNTQVNAQLWDNHAEHMADCTMAQHADACTSQQRLSAFGKDIDQTGELLKKGDICKERQTIIKASKESLCCYSPVKDSLSTVSKNCHEDEITENRCTLDSSDVVSKSTHLTRSETHNTDTSLKLKQPDKHRESLCCRKNSKALSLTIPKYSDLKLLHLEEEHSSSECTESILSLSCHKEIDEGDNDFVDVCAPRRSTRSNTLEGVRSAVEDKQSTRKAKLRSVYFKSAHNLKSKKRRKRQEPLIEGVHYIVVGKFKGHQAMLVKITRLNVKPTEICHSHYFEELAAKDIVRSVPPGNCPMYRECNGKADTETCDPNFGYKDHEFGTRASFGRASRGRPMQHTKYRSAQQQAKLRLDQQQTKFGSQLDQPQEMVQDECQFSSPNNQTESKNLMAGPNVGASKNNENRHHAEDKFFYKFKESFMRHCRLKEQAVNTELKDQEHFFFEGIRRYSFQVFQQKFVSNVQKLTSDDYSSSSDDEDDVLDTAIFKEKIHTPHKVKVFQVSHQVDLSEPVGQGHDKPMASHSLSDHVSNSGLQPGSPLASENSPGDERAFTKEQTYYVAKDHEGSSSCNGRLWDSIGWQRRSQEKVDRGPFFHGSNCEVGSKLVLKNMKCLTEEDNQMHCFENPTLCSITDSSTMKKDGEDKEDYLKCQMAFFEDISSDSDSNEAVIADRFIEKGELFQGYPPLSFSPSDQCSTKTAVEGEPTPDNHHIAVLNVLELSKDTECNGILSSDLRHDCAELPCSNGSNHNSEGSVANNSTGRSRSLDTNLIQVSETDPEFCQENSASVIKPIDQQKDVSFVPTNNVLHTDILSPASELETMKLVRSVSVSTINTSKCDNIDFGTTESDTRGMPLDTKHNKEAGITTATSQRQTRHGKRAKKSVRDRESKLHKIKPVTDAQGDRETTAALETATSGQNRNLIEQKRSYYTHPTEQLDSTDSGNEHFSIPVSQKKSSTIKSSSKIRDFKETAKNPPGTERGTKICPARGRRKKQTGGNKLLNSLSLLHMATLANLTETQPQTGDDQAVSETISWSEHEQHSWHNSDRFNHGYNSTSSFIQDQTISISPKNSPGQSSSKIQRRLTSKMGIIKDTALSTQLLDISENNCTRPKPECSVTSSMCSKPPAFGRILNNSASSIPSNFIFNHSSDAIQPEAAVPAEDAGTYNTLQLLETRRAQVNCASFSMKDILKLAAQDDSDSKSNTSLVRLTEPQRIREEDTAVCIRDASSETGNSHTYSTLSLLSNVNCGSDQASLLSTQTIPKATETYFQAVSSMTDLNDFQAHEETLEASGSLLSQLAKFTTPSSQISFETTHVSRSHLATFGNSLPEKCADTAIMGKTITGVTSGQVIGKRAPLNCIVNTNTHSTSSDINTNKTQYSGDVKGKPDDYPECISSSIRTIKECHKRADISSKPSASITHDVSPEPSKHADMKCLSVSLSPTPQKHIGGLDEAFTPTTGTIVQTAGVKNASMSCVEESDKPHFDSHSAIPSQVSLQSSVPETAVFAEIDIQNISLTSDESFNSGKQSCSIIRPQSVIPKQENRGNHKNLKVRNANRGLKPLHLLQIPPYPDHGSNAQWEHVFHNAKNSSVYYPYCWQWPAYMPGADPAVSPLNLCTTQKSPNNYSPITPTSPISPNYPTQAQGTAEFGLSSPVKTEKPLWYPWLKADTAKPETKLTSPVHPFRHHHKVYLKTSRGSSTSPVTGKDKEQTPENVCIETAQMESCDARFISELPRNSPGSFRGQFSFTRPASLKLGYASSAPGTVFNLLDSAYEPARENSPSTSGIESSTDASRRILPGDSRITRIDAKQSSRKHEEACNVSNSAYWSGDTSGTPDSLDSCQSNGSSFKSCASHTNENVCTITEAIENKSTPELGQEKRLTFKYERKPKGLSLLVNQPLKLSPCESGQTNHTGSFETKDIEAVKSESCQQKNADISGSSKPHAPRNQKRSTKMFNKNLHTRDNPQHKRRKYLNRDNITYEDKSS